MMKHLEKCYNRTLPSVLSVRFFRRQQTSEVLESNVAINFREILTEIHRKSIHDQFSGCRGV